jgi:hypothetical protein
MSHRAPVTTKKRTVVNNDNTGVMRNRLTVASFNKDTNVTFFWIKHSW